MNEKDRVRVQHMLDYAREVMSFTEGRKYEELEENSLLERALCYSVGIIGEAASHVSVELRETSSQIPWQNIIGMHNFLFHAYFQIESEILWRTATESIPSLAEQLETLLNNESGK